MSISDEIILNQISQRVFSMNAAINWFDSLTAQRRAEVLKTLGNMVNQSHPRYIEVETAIQDSQLKATYTPVILLTMKKPGVKLSHQVEKIVQLPPNEHAKAFILLMKLFQVSDTRRKQEKCGSLCSHWWHKDLSDEAVLKNLWVDITAPMSPEGVEHAKSLGREWLANHPLRMNPN